jgi:hypothetical protein
LFTTSFYRRLSTNLTEPKSDLKLGIERDTDLIKYSIEAGLGDF